jgi:hypothetical protein
VVDLGAAGDYAPVLAAALPSARIARVAAAPEHGMRVIKDCLAAL